MRYWEDLMQLKGIIKKHMDNHANNLDEVYHFHHLHIERFPRNYV